jgi:hypothetical protein
MSLVVLSIVLAAWRHEAAAAPSKASDASIVLEAEAAQLNTSRVDVADQDTFPSIRGVALKKDVASNVGSPLTSPDLMFQA